MSEAFFDESTEQSRIKSKIVSGYFSAWSTIITRSQHNDRIAYIDLFAGPGRYKDGTSSTPLLVLEKAVTDPIMAQRLVAIFNDRDENLTRTLETEISKIPNIAKLKFKPIVINEEIGDEIVKQFEEMRMIPTLFFVDPWGYKGLSLRLVNAVVKDWACECVFFFNYNRINMGLGNPIVREHLDALFGGAAEQLRTKLNELDPDSRELLIVERLIGALNPDGNRFVLPFRFRRESGRTSHHLFFVTKHFLGYDIMKSVMAKESSTTEQDVASFEFSPADERFPYLFDLNRPLEELAEMLLQKYSRLSITFGDLYEVHSVGLPYIKKNYRAVLEQLENDGKVSTRRPDGKKRRKGTMPPDTIISFGEK